MTPYRLSLGWLTVENRRLLQIATLEFMVLSTKQPTYLFELFTIRTDANPRRVSPRHVPEPLIYSTPRTVTQQNSFHIVASKYINTFVMDMIPFSLLALQRLKFLARMRLSISEALDWKFRVIPDPNLVLNPLPANEELRTLLKRAVLAD